jgi:phosphoglycerate dehydrogenase-like enzyme
MKLLLPVQIRDHLAPLLPSNVDPVWVAADGSIEGDPVDATAYFRWWSNRPILGSVLAAAPAVRWMHTPSAGVDHLLIPEVFERDIVLTNSAGVHAIPIAEFVLAFMLDRSKQLPLFRAAQAERRWAKELEPQELFEKIVLIIGIGGIGHAIATRAAAFGMRVWGSRRTPRPMSGVERVVGSADWRTLLPEADYVVIAAPLTPETTRMIDADALALMKPSAYLINVARGAVIDEPALIAALQTGRISGAALDTFTHEPLDRESPLWGLPNVVMTPHSTAFSPRMRERQMNLFLENLRRVQVGEPLLNVVDKAVGY